MKTSKKMQEVITRLAEKYGLDLTAPEAYLRLDMEHFDRLVIEKIGERLVSVAHYFEQHGDLIADPEVVFFMGDAGWIPFEITQVLGGYRKYATLTPDEQRIDRVNPRGQAELARFAKFWAQNIKLQGWLEHAQKWDRCDPTKSMPPDEETLRRWWQEDGGCEAVDGCWVEPDGTCPHGCPSWLTVLGLI